MGNWTSKPQPASEGDLVILALPSAGSSVMTSFIDMFRGKKGSTGVQGWNSKTFKSQKIEIQLLRNTSSFRQPVVFILPQAFGGKSDGPDEYKTITRVRKWLLQKKVLQGGRYIDHILLFPGSPKQVQIKNSLAMTLGSLVDLGGENLEEIRSKTDIVLDPGVQPNEVPEKWKELFGDGGGAHSEPLSLTDPTGGNEINLLEEVLRVVMTS